MRRRESPAAPSLKIWTGAAVALGTARAKMNRNNIIDNPFTIQSCSSIYMDARENGWGSTPLRESLFSGEIHYQRCLDGPEAGVFQGRKP